MLDQKPFFKTYLASYYNIGILGNILLIGAYLILDLAPSSGILGINRGDIKYE